jgi:hypothetical protein
MQIKIGESCSPYSSHHMFSKNVRISVYKIRPTDVKLSGREARVSVDVPFCCGFAVAVVILSFVT